MLTKDESAKEIVHYLHTDHLGAVVKASDADRKLVWDVERRPFGQREIKIAQIEMPLGLPGQYFDDESGNYYNYFRDYDPSTGRYLQSDPIGLRGGMNTYAYVGGNPLFWIDPFGLINLQLPGTSGETTVHANPGPDVVPPGARSEHEPSHVHLGSNEGPRVRTDTFEPLTPEDARRMSGKQKKFCKKLTDQAKNLIRTRQQHVFKYGRVMAALMATPPMFLDSVMSTCRQDPFFCAENMPNVFDQYKEQHCDNECE